MQFVPRARRHPKLTGERNPGLYPHCLQIYKIPPLYTISLEEFERLALERLQVLRTIERAGIKHSRNAKEFREAVLADLRKQNLYSYVKITVDGMDDNMYDERRRDHISHFILRLAYCRSEELRRWFVTQEVELFRFRFISETAQNRKSFMKLNNLDYEPIEEEERDALAGELAGCGFKLSSAKIGGTDYYKVPFTEVLDLVKCRRVYLRRGYAYIPESDLVSIVVTVFRTHLSHALAVTSRAIPQLEEDGRLLSMLGSIHQRYIGNDYLNKKTQFTGEVSPEMIDSLSKTSFPLCMRTLHDTLRRTHHLRYGGRQQYGLFLKGIGLSLEDALRFWREEFSKIMDIDKFDRQYSYNIRHNYGKEGKRANYTPHNCMKIITSSSPGPGDAHGCPFKHSDAGTLKQRLMDLRISSSGITDIMDLVSKGHYQLACTRYFEVTHNEATVDQAINHPNQFYEESQKVKKGESKTSSRHITGTKTQIYASAETSQDTPPFVSQNTASPIDLMDCDSLPDDIEDLFRNIQE